MRLINMTTPQVAEYFKKNDTVLFAMGSIENHGYHNCVGVDTLVPDRILDLVEKKCDVLIVPTLPYGACDSMLGFPGTISLGTEVLYGVVNKVVESLHMHGARRILFINGHGGNTGALERVGLEWYKKGVITATLSWWSMLAGLRPDDPAWVSGHGGGVETAAIMAIDPSLVDLSALREMELLGTLGDELPPHGFGTVKFKGVEIKVNRPIKSFTDNGWFGWPDHPKTATAEWGQEMLDAVADYTAEFIEAFKRAKI